MEATLHSFGFPADANVLLAYREINESYWRMLERGEISQEALALARHQALFERFGFSGDVEAFQNQYERALSESSYLYDDALDLLDQLRSHTDCHLIIVTNGFARIQERRIALSGLDAYFERVFISEHVGFRKPQVEYFEYVFKTMGGEGWEHYVQERHLPEAPHHDFLPISKDRALIIGDSLTSDIKGGADFGIATCWFNPSGEANTLGVKVDHEIQRLNEILGLVL